MCKAARTTNAVLGQIARAFHYRDRWTFIRLNQLYVRPHLELSVAAWSPWTQNDIECLERVQRRAISIVFGMGEKNYEERLAELHLTTLQARREEISLIETFKIMRGFSHVKMDTWFAKFDAGNGDRPSNRQTAASETRTEKELLQCESVRSLKQAAQCSETLQQCKIKSELKKLRASHLTQV